MRGSINLFPWIFIFIGMTKTFYNLIIMPNSIPKLNPEKEKKKIITFINKILSEQKIDKVVIGLSGGIDSMTSFYLLKEALPLKNIIVTHLYYKSPNFNSVKKILDGIGFPKQNIYLRTIKNPVDEIVSLTTSNNVQIDRIRKGNIIARVRMITLFDLAKKHKALVCGTENKSEKLLGYFTRFGDQASDIEPISHLYKTQVYALARHLGIPDEIVNRAPSAGLWENQTDEKEIGFTYKEADQVLYLSIDKNLTLEEIQIRGFKNAKKILEYRKKNIFKHKVPYVMSGRRKLFGTPSP